MTRSFILAGALIAVALSACTDNMAPPCPSVRVDSTTAKLTKFKDGPGRDAADVAYQAEVVAYEGECVFSDEGVEVRMDLDFSVATGPAVTAGRESIFYFVAVPQLFPKPEGKQIFQFRADLPATPGARERTRENNLRIFIPLQKNEPAASYDVYVGLQLTNEQLEYNRSQNP